MFSPWDTGVSARCQCAHPAFPLEYSVSALCRRETRYKYLWILTHPLLNHSAVKLTPYCSATLLWCTLVPPGRDCGHLPQKPHGREQVFIEHMAGEISNHGHNMVSELTRTDWCFFSPQRPLNGAVLTLVYYSRYTPLPGCRPSC